jgi:WD40 repeat protein
MASCDDPSRLVWSVDGKTFVATDWAKATPRSDGETPMQLDLGWQVPSALGLSETGDRLLMGDTWGGLKVWSIPPGDDVWKPEIGSQVICLAIARDVTQGVASSGDSVWWFDFQSKVMERVELDPRVATSDVAAVAISSDGRKVAVGMSSGPICLYDVSQRRRVATAAGHSRRVRWLDFSPDAETLASGSDDGHLRLWDPEMGYERLALPTRQPVDIVVFAADGNQFAAGCRDGSIHIWRAKSD